MREQIAAVIEQHKVTTNLNRTLLGTKVDKAKQAIIKCRTDSPHHYLILWRVYFNIRTTYNNYADRYYLTNDTEKHPYTCGYKLVHCWLGCEVTEPGVPLPTDWYMQLNPETIIAMAEIAEEDGVPEKIFEFSPLPFKMKIKAVAKKVFNRA